MVDSPAISPHVTSLLNSWSAGDRAAERKVLPLIYDELRRVARAGLNGDAGYITMEATDLVNEAYLRLGDQRDTAWQNREHFFAISATIVRRILLDAARKRLADRRDRRREAISLDASSTGATPMQAMTYARAVEMLDLDAALGEFSIQFPRQARLVELRFFSGLTVEESAAYLNVSRATAKRDWHLAKAWLYDRLHERIGSVDQS